MPRPGTNLIHLGEFTDNKQTDPVGPALKKGLGCSMADLHGPEPGEA